MKKLIALAIIAALLIPGTALAKRKPRAAQAFDPGTAVALDADGNVTLLTFQGNPYTLWGARWCLEREVPVAEFNPVIWGDNNDPSPTQGTVTFSISGPDCQTYIWEFPATHDPVSNIV